MNKIALAVASVVVIMTIFATVLILSGRTVHVTGEALIYEPNLQQSIIVQEDPCSLIRCIGGRQPILLGFEGIPIFNQYALCVCADIRQGVAYYDELQIKKIQTTRQY